MTSKTIVVATDFSELSQAALQQAKELARATGSKIHLVHVVDELAARYIDLPDYPQMGQLQTTLERSAHVRLEEIAGGDPSLQGASTEVLTSRSTAEAIVSFARDVHADLIVIGTHGRSGIGRFFLGSVAERLLRIAQCPVLTVPQRTSAAKTDERIREAAVQA